MERAMKSMIFTAISNTFSVIKRTQVARFLSIVLVGFLFLTSNVGLNQNDRSLGERMRDRIQQVDQNTERPKTTGEWLDEVEGDVPFGERVQNTIRDSKEAFGQFGKEYSVGAQESARNVQESAGNAIDDITN
jgi:hypothetical protein